MDPDSSGFMLHLNTVYMMAVGDSEMALQGASSASSFLTAYDPEAVQSRTNAGDTST
jgi:hypothetical protein